MRLLIFLLLFCADIYALKSFSPSQFVNIHNLKLPAISEKMLDFSKHAHESDSWRYFYIGKSGKIDSVYNYRKLRNFHELAQIHTYEYRDDTTLIAELSIAQDNGDTLSRWVRKISQKGRFEVSIDINRNCTWYHKRNKWGKRIYEKKQCPGDEEPEGSEFNYIDRGDYIESIKTKKGKVDSNSIRRYYFTDFDSVVADYIVTTYQKPTLVSLIKYGKNKKVKTKFGFNSFDTLNSIVNINHYEYDSKNRLFREYYLTANDFNDPSDGYQLANYTQFEYDSLGRLKKKTTWVVPEESDKDKEKK
ncbi:MAG: hypothetical protein GF401_05250 [Chitinivibrionales bacterium]|nr:hypothetical protein [Chitinivibrionales bacterium]